MTLWTGVQRTAIALMLPSLMFGAACSGGGAKKFVVSESVCANARFLRMDLGERHKVVLDNGRFSEGQSGMSFRFERFPLQIEGDLPANTTIDGNLTTVGLSAAPGEESSIVVVPTQAGTYTAQCGTIILGRSSLTEVRILIV